MKSRHTNAKEEWEIIRASGCTPQEVRCDVCGELHYQGKGCYPLQKVSGYEMFCCQTCLKGNWDGWNRCHEQKILEHLKAKGIKPPRRNEKGYLPMEFLP